MIPVWAIPLVVHFATKLIDLAFKETKALCPETQEKVLDKIEENDLKEQNKRGKKGEDDYGY